MATDTEPNPKDLDERYRIDEDRRVYVYRNLHKGCWSVRQDGLIKLHTDHICLFDCQFRVGKKGREKVLREKRKNVHAGVSGYIDSKPEHQEWAQRHPNAKSVTYNPYEYETFVFQGDKSPIKWSSVAELKDGSVSAVPCKKFANTY